MDAFKQFGRLKAFVDPNFSGRTWNEASAMVIQGKAMVQQMGDWAKGEFTNAKKTPDVDYACFRFPGTQANVIFNADVFAMFKLPEDRQAAQAGLASAVMSVDGQTDFNLLKGAIPARTDISDAKFDACGKKSIGDLKAAETSGKLVPSGTLSALPAAMKGVLYDVATRYFHGQIDEDAAAKAVISGFGDTL